MNFKMFLETSSNYYKGGVYVVVLPDDKTNKSLQEYQSQNLQNENVNTKLHSTLIYSAKPQKEKVICSNTVHNAKFDGFDLFGDDKNILVMKLKCKSLSDRNEELTNDYGFISDYDSYNPHITLAYDVKDMNLEDLPKFEGDIVLTNEYAEDLDEDWKPE